MEYATAGIGTTQFAVALRSLKRYKRTSTYRIQLIHTLREATRDAMDAPTPMEQRRARLRAIEAEAELDLLLHGEKPDMFRGLIHFGMPDEDDR